MLSTEQEKYQDYLKMLERDFTKVVRLEWLNPNETIREVITENFIEQGTLNCNLQNGIRRNASIRIDNYRNQFGFNTNQLWFNQKFRLRMGLILSNGDPYFINQGVFLAKDPTKDVSPGSRFVDLQLVDKWANLNGDLFGKLESTYQIPRNTPVFSAMESLITADMGNGEKIDTTLPEFTNYYKDKMVTLATGEKVPFTNTPYTLTQDSETGTRADILTELNDMIVGLIGYDRDGRLRVEPSQENILDSQKEILWNYTIKSKQFLGFKESIKNGEVANMIVVCGATTNNKQAHAIARNDDPNSTTAIGRIGERIYRVIDDKYVSDEQCQDYANYLLKKKSIVQSSITVSSTQMFHLQENRLITIERPDKNNAIEKHLISSFSLPISAQGAMTVNATSINDIVA